MFDQPASTEPGIGYTPLAGSIVVALLSWQLLEYAFPAHGLHQDTNEDILRAMYCATEGVCRAAASSMRGFKHSEVWIHILAFFRGFELSIGQLHSAFLASAAFGVGMAYRAYERFFGWQCALLGACICLYLLVVEKVLLVMWNPSIMPLFGFAAFYGWVQYHLHSGWGRFITLAALSALAVSTHPAMIYVAPGVCLGAALKHTDWKAATRDMIALGILIIGFMAFCSPIAFGNNARSAYMALPASTAAIGLAAFIAVFYAWHRVLKNRPPRMQLTLWCAAMVIVVMGIGFVGSLVRNRPHYFELRYSFAALPAMGFLGCWLVSLAPRPIRHIRSILVIVAICGVAYGAQTFHKRRSHAQAVTQITLEDLDAAYAELRASGLSRNSLWANLSGGGCHSIQDALHALSFPKGTDDMQGQGALLYLLKAQPGDETDEWPGQWTKISNDIIVGRTPSYVRRSRMTLCAQSPMHPTEQCSTMDLSEGLDRTGTGSQQANPHPTSSVGLRHVALEVKPGQRVVAPFRARYILEVLIPPHGETRELHMVSGGYNLDETYRIVEDPYATGVPTPHQARLEGGETARRYRITVEQPIHPNTHRPTLRPPCFVEAPSGADPAWLSRMGVR